MPLITDNSHIKKLNKHNINIKTKYIVDDKILERNTNNTINDDIIKGIRCQKLYYINNNLVHIEKDFDSRIEYTFISQNVENEDYKCINCGMRSKIKDFIDGCPYCRTYYNIDYTAKDLGSKYHYDRVLRSNLYRIIVGIIDLIISIFLSYIFIISTSRTFNSVDITKIYIYGFILSLILYYFFYLLDAYIILTPIKIYKDKQNKKQIEFWNRTQIDKKIFFNNLNYEIRNLYYSKDNIIDYDIIDYIDFKEYTKDNKLHVKIKVEVRIMYLKNNKIIPKYIKGEFILQKHDNGTITIKDGINLIKCHNCGASIDATKGICEFCRTEIKYLQEWILIDEE